MKTLKKISALLLFILTTSLFAEAHPYHFNKVIEMSRAEENNFYVSGLSGESFDEDCALEWIVKLDSNGDLLWQYPLDYLRGKDSLSRFRRAFFQPIKNKTTAVLKYNTNADKKQTQLNLRLIDSAGKLISHDSTTTLEDVSVSGFKYFENGRYIIWGDTYNSGQYDLWLAEMNAQGELLWVQKVNRDSSFLSLIELNGKSSENFRFVNRISGANRNDSIRMSSVNNGKLEFGDTNFSLGKIQGQIFAEYKDSNSIVIFALDPFYDSTKQKYFTRVKNYELRDNHLESLSEVIVPKWWTNASINIQENKEIQFMISNKRSDSLWQFNYKPNGSFEGKKLWGSPKFLVGRASVILPNGNKVFSVNIQEPWHRDFKIAQVGENGKVIWNKKMPSSYAKPLCLFKYPKNKKQNVNQ